MAVYMLIEIAVKDSEMYIRYIEKVLEIVERHGGRYLVRGGQVTPLSGNWNPERIVLIEFGNMEQLQRCFQSPEYLELAPLREQSTTSRSIVAEGYWPPG
jgi:uncharacterized protein (DUF1330 family)